MSKKLALRLRKEVNIGSGRVTRLRIEAADEINRLSAALLAIASAPEHARLADHDLVEWMSDHARAVISEEA